MSNMLSVSGEISPTWGVNLWYTLILLTIYGGDNGEPPLNMDWPIIVVNEWNDAFYCFNRFVCLTCLAFRQSKESG